MRKLSLEELNRLSVEEYRASAKIPVSLVLDNIRSGLNVGSAFRTADAFSLTGIKLCGITGTPPHREILKTAIGATESVNWEYHEDVVEAIKALKESGYKILVIEQTDESTGLQDLMVDISHPVALVFGNEVSGVSEEVLPLADLFVEIPQYGTKHSLNISVCLGVVSWEVFKQYKFKQ